MANRFFFLISSVIVWLGNYNTGFSIVSWLLYIPAVFFLLASITGYCFGMIISTMIFKENK